MPVEDKVNGEYRTINARLVDYDHPEKNDFRIINQWTVEEFATKRCDLVVMLNGFPVVVMELKSPTNEDVGENERKILSIIAHTPQASAREMAEVLGITPRQCERILASLKEKGLIARVGAAKGGHWKIRL